jgi:uncharacterized protein YcbK (DUF882 family)
MIGTRSFSSRTMTDADWTSGVVKHFTRDEFRHPEQMGYEFMLWLDKVREAAGVPMHVTSDYRSHEHNADVHGAEDSAHCDIPCNSVDIGMRPTLTDPNWNYARFKIVEAAMHNGCARIGTYANGSLHLDRTENSRPAPRMWRVVDNPAHSPL